MLHFRVCWADLRPAVPAELERAYAKFGGWLFIAYLPFIWCCFSELLGSFAAFHPSIRLRALSTAWAHNSFSFLHSLIFRCFHTLRKLAGSLWLSSRDEFYNNKKIVSTAEALCVTAWCTTSHKMDECRTWIAKGKSN